MRLRTIYESKLDEEASMMSTSPRTLKRIIDNALEYSGERYHAVHEQPEFISVIYDSNGDDVVMLDRYKDVLTIKSPETDGKLYYYELPHESKLSKMIDYIGSEHKEGNNLSKDKNWKPYTHKTGIKDASMYDEFFYDLNK